MALRRNTVGAKLSPRAQRVVELVNEIPGETNMDRIKELLLGLRELQDTDGVLLDLDLAIVVANDEYAESLKSKSVPYRVRLRRTRNIVEEAWTEVLACDEDEAELLASESDADLLEWDRIDEYTTEFSVVTAREVEDE